MSNGNKVVPIVLDKSKVLHNSSSVVSSNNRSKLSLDELERVSGSGNPRQDLRDVWDFLCDWCRN